MSNLSIQDPHIITSDQEALDIASQLADDFRVNASQRDDQRILPREEIERYSTSGLWGAIVPKEYGGAEIAVTTLVKTTAIISEADPSIGQIPQPHYCLVDAVRILGSDEQKNYFFREALAGKRFGNAVSERGKTYETLETRLSEHEGRFTLNGIKSYSTGSTFADWVPVAGHGPDGKGVLVYVSRSSDGLSVEDDWTGMGQRTTASGTVICDNVNVEAWQIFPRFRLFESPTIHGPYAQVLHAAIDFGIGKAALTEASEWVQRRARPWKDSAAQKASEDPLTTVKVGELVIQLHATDCMLERAAAFVDVARCNPTDQTVGEASIAVAEAKVLSTRFALEACNIMFELAGTASSLEEHNLSRHWRNARTHTLHDPVRWKPHLVGDHWLNAVLPPRHASV